MRIVILMISLYLLTGCGNAMKGLSTETATNNSVNEITSQQQNNDPMNSNKESTSLGKGIYTASTNDFIELDKVEQMTDEEIIDQHIKLIEEMIVKLKNDGSNLSNEELTMREQLILDLENRVKELKQNEDLRQQFVEEVRALAQEIEENNSLGGQAAIDASIACRMLKDLLDLELIPSEIRSQEANRYQETCL